MLFSISETGWALIAIVATASFMAGMHVFVTGLPMPERETRPNMKLFHILTPLFAAVVLWASLLRPDSGDRILFLYSVAFVSIPVALLPVRGRLSRTYTAQRREPGAEVKTDVLATAWICGFLLAVLLVAVAALMAYDYGA
ncbi:hypothetical protein [Actinomadura sp. WAC 06369]|uniref:hypothetical protein n=1 Tax=Actinomadura sp. WAC 06369 TaxID=2203193 RepID=UPI000F779B9C|nr:hypothetical protein [Actinomadura sp. WAC 06369]RSN46487.1 hypothetical protein DMH08_35920 [Actinomadura sp. WAC 06369]